MSANADGSAGPDREVEEPALREERANFTPNMCCDADLRRKFAIVHQLAERMKVHQFMSTTPDHDTVTGSRAVLPKTLYENEVSLEMIRENEVSLEMIRENEVSLEMIRENEVSLEMIRENATKPAPWCVDKPGVGTSPQDESTVGSLPPEPSSAAEESPEPLWLNQIEPGVNTWVDLTGAVKFHRLGAGEIETVVLGASPWHDMCQGSTSGSPPTIDVNLGQETASESTIRAATESHAAAPARGRQQGPRSQLWMFLRLLPARAAALFRRDLRSREAATDARHHESQKSKPLQSFPTCSVEAGVNAGSSSPNDPEEGE